jgi:hypothetical protein
VKNARNGRNSILRNIAAPKKTTQKQDLETTIIAGIQTTNPPELGATQPILINDGITVMFLSAHQLLPKRIVGIHCRRTIGVVLKKPSQEILA